MNEGRNSRNDVKVVVSDAMAQNSRQLLNAHIYNYLIQNKRYDTARQFLLEADVPVFEERKRNDEERVRQEPAGGLLPAKMLMDCEDTFLYEWWESFDSLQRFVDSTPSEAFMERTSQAEHIVPVMPSNTGIYNVPGAQTPQGPSPGAIQGNSGFTAHQGPPLPNNTSPAFVPHGHHGNLDVSEDGTPMYYPQDNGGYPRQR